MTVVSWGSAVLGGRGWPHSHDIGWQAITKAPWLSSTCLCRTLTHVRVVKGFQEQQKKTSPNMQALFKPLLISVEEWQGFARHRWKQKIYSHDGPIQAEVIREQKV